MTSADAYLGRLVSATDDDATWTVAEEVVVLEGVDAALRFASAWGASADPDVRAAAFDLLSCVTLDLTTAAPGLILELAARVTSRDGRYLRWSAAHALQQMGCNLWVEAATALPDASYLDALRRLLEAGPSDAPGAPSAADLSEAIEAAALAGRAPRLPGQRTGDDDPGR
ncbi:hypothetical protein [Cellulomonas cellasea]|uniref:HEAT repeat domain-containing protein n=1 Tax=Cellulomonas cellasea TaxID=43670 RepID=A0A7W4UGF2_9CELL|nr:hypothetical protein [Cellulomonas cellasea]MBB2923716.1 hypothetical protein [Cellulomonas cellasea]